MATSKYSGPILLGYYVFDLPNGQVLDMCSSERVLLPDNLSNLPARYVERVLDPLVGVLPKATSRRSPAEDCETVLQSCDRLVTEVLATTPNAVGHVTVDELASIGEKTRLDRLEATLQNCDRLAVELKLAQHEPTEDDLLGLGKLSDKEMELLVFGNVQPHAEVI